MQISEQEIRWMIQDAHRRESRIKDWIEEGISLGFLNEDGTPKQD